jgi:hypothetical protein
VETSSKAVNIRFKLEKTGPFTVFVNQVCYYQQQQYPKAEKEKPKPAFFFLFLRILLSGNFGVQSFVFLNQ